MFLQIDMGCQYALKQLNSRSLSPVRRLLLAQRLTITEWIPSAFRDLLNIYTPVLSLSDYQALGPRNLWVIECTRAKIQYHRRSVAFRAPAVVHDPAKCRPADRQKCNDTWSAAWWGGFCPLYLHPDRPVSSEEALCDLENACIPMMEPECQALTVKALAMTDALQREETMITIAIEELGN